MTDDRSGPQAMDSEPMYALEDCDSLPVTGGVLLVAKATGARVTVMQEVAMALQHCAPFRTLDGHARHLVAVFPQLGGNVEDALRVLRHVQDAGLLLPAADICQRVNGPVDANAELDRTVVCIITCDRPAAVERLLESLLRGARLARHKKLYLIDDSREAAHCAANEEAVQRFNLLSPTGMSYIGPVQQQALLGFVIERLPQREEAIRFLLDRSQWQGLASYGRARTLALLLTVGERCIVMDDDVLCAAYRLPQQHGEVTFGNGQREADFFRDTQDWQQQVSPLETDPLAGHGSCLGLNLSAALGALGCETLTPGHLADGNAIWYRDIHAASPVLITQSGSLGDPGTATNGWLPNLQPVSLQRMLRRPGGLFQALSQRHNWLGQPQPTFTKRGSMSQLTGLDNRHVLPPYFPVLRGEDQLFGTMTDILYPDSLSLEYNWSVPHLPLEERRGNGAGDATVPRGGLSLLEGFLSGARCADAGPGVTTRMERLACRLDELAELSTSGLQAQFRTALLRAQALHLQTLGDRLRDSASLDADWQSYLQDNQQACIQAMQEVPGLARLPGVPRGLDEEAIAAGIRSRAAGFGAALRAWQDLRSVSATAAMELFG
ncbi:hypothetical protein [Kineobactrum salinum]|uniref:Uncharacterized protein n=1 Tax=Kineobactrum salinum TaxID=2708301 RepID=A0A6C0U3L3_9GAMM|nr:hypothetical protein [Kineobactrum salinum]QIB66019.1 hypothetical protein G3T16_11930 [Kineobactrum salinum]